jgi:predicted HAD superfamily Cof-like phosphohydrolase
MTTKTQHDMVTEFHARFGIPVRKVPQELNQEEFNWRHKFLQEELRELGDAWTDGNLVGQVDALLDLAYVVHGTAVLMGLPWDLLFPVVHDCNMQKVSYAEAKAKGLEVGEPRHTYDVRKPPGWQGPEGRLWALLRAVHIHHTGEEGPFK